MKFLKKTFAYILPAMMVLGGATACTDFIEIDPENKVPEQGVDFTNKNNMYQPVVGAYSKVRTQGMHWCNALLMFTRDGDVWSGRTDDQGDAVAFGRKFNYNNSFWALNQVWMNFYDIIRITNAALQVWSGRTDDQGDAVAFGRKFNYNNSFWALNQVWMNFYDIIRITNAALQSLDGYAAYLAAGSEDYKTYESYCGEVRTIRAWAYYCLVTNFGPTVIYRDNLQTDFRRSTVEAVYNYMLEDLNYAIEKLPRMRPNQMEHKGAVTAFTAQALAARIYLLKGDYAQVETLTDDIIKNGGFRLYDDFYQLFKIPGKLCDESLFECQVTDYGNGSGDYLGVDQWFNFQGPNMAERYDEVVNADGTISYKQAEGTKSIGGWNFIGYEPEFVTWAEARGEGVRAETSFLKALSKTREGWQVGPTSATKTDCWNGKGYLPYNQMTRGEGVRAETSFLKALSKTREGWQVGPTSATKTDCWNGKGYLPYNQMTLPRTTYGANNNVRIIRYAEVLLMNSEAKVRLGKDGDAGYNEVRQRAGMSTKTGVTLKDVMDERRMELCGEWCARYVDLVRTGDAATVLGPKGWTAEKTYWPIPANQLDDLPDLKLEPIDGIAE